jgi:hypothetical protein
MDTDKLRSLHLGQLALFDKAMQLGHNVGFQLPANAGHRLADVLGFHEKGRPK